MTDPTDPDPLPGNPVPTTQSTHTSPMDGPIDLRKPLVAQVASGAFSSAAEYHAWIHRPKDFRPRLFHSDLMELCTNTKWWVIPLLWGPVVLVFMQPYALLPSASAASLVGYFLLGLGVWSLIEYCLHRFLFHCDEWLPEHRLGLTAHFLLHGIHHKFMNDELRLVMPPALTLVISTGIYFLAQRVFFFLSPQAFSFTYGAGLLGYIAYDQMHYALHHVKANSPLVAAWPFFSYLKRYHMRHHYVETSRAFGITSDFWDRVLGTMITLPAATGDAAAPTKAGTAANTSAAASAAAANGPVSYMSKSRAD